MTTQNSELAPLLKPEGATLDANSYIVLFKESLEASDVKASMQTVADIMEDAGGKNSIKREYNIGQSFRGFAATLDEETLTRIWKLASIKYVECDAMASIQL